MGKHVPMEALIDLEKRPNMFPPRSSERRKLAEGTAHLFGVSEATIYRGLGGTTKPKSLQWSDRGKARVIPPKEMARYCLILAALKLRTRNKKGRSLSTNEGIRLLEEFGIETADGMEKAPKGLFLRFLYGAMAPKKVAGFPFEGIPKMIYIDHGPIARSGVFHRVMDYMGNEVKSYLPAGKDGRRTTAGAKGKMARPFRTVKDLHETLLGSFEASSLKISMTLSQNYRGMAIT